MEIDAAEIGDDVARRVVDHDRREAGIVAEPACLAARQIFRRALQIAVDPGIDLAAGRHRHQMLRQERRREREGQAAIRHRLAARLGLLLRGDDAVREEPRQHLVAPGARGGLVPVGTQPLRRLRQRHQERRLAER